ncbi:hypothetical protein BdWA1_000332 [Babesia duncani]|uniref:Uncharacterized protein n=1 Tax=Babesia duncani TaxID=323732 RepID=A0AAD9UPQ6_9APIC|nr:hypothetical protein BdWA1_000332 [Babesia duncani]
MASSTSPVADDPITRLQYMLQNTLYSFVDIVTTLTPQVAQEFKTELAQFGLSTEVLDGRNGLSDENPLSSHQGISARVESIGALNDQIQATISQLPNSDVGKVSIKRTSQ